MDAGPRKREECKNIKMDLQKCKICRRQGAKLFLKGERCFSAKCSVMKRPYPPGIKTKMPRKSSEYGKELKEKQKMRNWYNLRERQFKTYVNKALKMRGKAEDAGSLLVGKIVSRLDNVVFRLGFASSRAKARQLVSHNHFLVNGKKVNIPSYETGIGDKIQLSPNSRKKAGFEGIESVLKKQKFPSWVEFDLANFEAKIIGKPTEDTEIPAEILTIFEYYSK